MDDLINTQLGQYQLAEIIRQGGMATVYKAYQPALERFVAIKVLLYNRDPQFAVRFKREARAIAQLQHPNILPIYDFGEQGHLLYLVLQYIENGNTLGDLLGKPMPPVQALRLVMHLLNALDYAHRRGIIHRDIKPANILMASPTWPMLADFGIAKLLNESQQNLTSPGLIVGTAAYMAPEQAMSAMVDARTDIYSAGVVLYEMVVGRVPFDATTPMAMLTKHAYEAPPPPRSLNPHLSPLVEELLLRALAKDPKARFQSAAEMAEELGRVISALDQVPVRDQLISLYQSGKRAFEEGQWDLAVERLGELASLDSHYKDATELLEAAQVAQERARQEANRLSATLAANAYVRKLIRQGQDKQSAGDLAGALEDYRRAQAATPIGGPHDELAALITDVLARIEAPAQLPHCPQCGREVQREWTGCPYCRAPLKAPAGSSPLDASAQSSQPARSTSESQTITVQSIDKPKTILRPDSVPSASRKWLVWMIPLVVLGLGGGGVILARQRPSTPVVASPSATGSSLAGAGTATRAAISTARPLPTLRATDKPAIPPTNTAPPTTAPMETSAPTDTPAPTAEPNAVVKSATLRLRAGPSTVFSELGVYTQGTEFKVLGKDASGQWLSVESPDHQAGWMALENLQLNVDLANLPAVEAPPAPTSTVAAQPTPRPTVRRPTARPAAQPTAEPPPQPTSQPAPQPTPEPPPQPTAEPPAPDPPAPDPPAPDPPAPDPPAPDPPAPDPPAPTKVPIPTKVRLP